MASFEWSFFVNYKFNYQENLIKINETLKHLFFSRNELEEKN